MKKIDTIIFDLDGTLLDTLDDLKNSIVYVQEKNGFPVHSREMVRRNVGNGMPNLISKSVPEGTSQEKQAEILADFKAHYAVHSTDFTKPYPGVMELLEATRQEGYKIAIVSNKADAAVKLLNEKYFEDYFTVVIGENEAAGIRKKPAPDTVLAAVEQLGSQVENCVYIGDSEVDILTAKNSEMPCILCEWGFRDKEELMEQGGNIFVSNAMDILKEIKKL
ncbi:MAG: HAD family hydrolase [Eubacteriales bacterium]|nr:HAD family hydrolase [Eubacteriales bacterium]